MKKFYLTAAMMVVALTVCAQAISLQQARERANNFLKSAPTVGHRASSSHSWMR